MLITKEQALQVGFKSMWENSLRLSFVVYMNNLQLNRCTGRCIEIGTAEGYNAYSMLSHSDISLVLVDNYVESPEFEQRALDRLQSFKDRIQIIRKDSIEASKDFPDGEFEYIYIDGGHEYETVLRDCIAWWPKLKEGGVFAGHDWWKESVKKAVLEFANTNGKIGIVNGVETYHRPNSIPSSNLADMCDWWIYK